VRLSLSLAIDWRCVSHSVSDQAGWLAARITSS